MKALGAVRRGDGSDRLFFCHPSSRLHTVGSGVPSGALEGTLAQGPEGTAVVSWEFGEQAVQWPDGFVVEQEPELRLLDGRGELVASEGDPIYVGGGFTPGDEVFIACGYVSSDPP